MPSNCLGGNIDGSATNSINTNHIGDFKPTRIRVRNYKGRGNRKEATAAAPAAAAGAGAAAAAAAELRGNCLLGTRV